MANKLYIAGAGYGCGKSLVVLGAIEALRGNQRVGFFRPLVERADEPDRLISLVQARYELPFTHEQMFGCTEDVAARLTSAGKRDELIERVLRKYKELEERCDLVVVAGTDFRGVGAPFEADFNAMVANNLGCPVVAVADGSTKTPREVVESVGMFLRELQAHGSQVIAIVANRVQREHLTTVLSELQVAYPQVPSYTIPELALLSTPSVGVVADAIGARRLFGSPEAFARDIQEYKVAAIELSHFLERLEPNSLIIVPGDRSDIILGTIAAELSTQHPHLAGLVLTGGFEPAPPILKILEGLGQADFPVVCVDHNTFKTAAMVSRVAGTIRPDDTRKIAAALGLFENHVNVAELTAKVNVGSGKPRVTPLLFEYELLQRARSQRKTIVLPEGSDERILRAAEILQFRDVVDLIILGDEEELHRRMRAIGVSLANPRIINPATSELRTQYAEIYHSYRAHKGMTPDVAYDLMGDGSFFGTMMVKQGLADGMVSGAINTTQHTIRPSFEFIKTKPGTTIVSSVFFMCLKDRVLVYGDCAVNPDPTAPQLAEIAIDAAGTAAQFGIEPRVAMLSYSTGSSGKGADVDKVREATEIAKARRPDLLIDGPLQYDAAIDAAVARTKAPNSPVAGQATVLIFPDLNTGNNTYKAVQRSAEAVAIGPVLQGLNKPVNDLSRGCLVPDIVNTVAITAIQAQRQDGEVK